MADGRAAPGFMGAFLSPIYERRRRSDDVGARSLVGCARRRMFGVWRLLSGLRSGGSPDGFRRTRSALWPWDYSSQPFNLGGHTCLGIALVWGAAGVAWVKLALPVMQRAADGP